MAQAWRDAAGLWARGAWQSLQFQRAVAFCLADGRILKKCARGALLNGAVFYGSLVYSRRVLTPVVEGLLAWGMGGHGGGGGGGGGARATATLILLLYDLLWILPVYCVSLLVSVVWCQDVADLALASVDGRARRRPAGQGSGRHGPGARSPDLLGKLSEKAYTVLVLSLFYGQVALVGMLPRVGPPAACLLLSWLWAYYCFDYVWSFRGVGLRARLLYFETNAAFFSGFGALCAGITAACSPYTAAAFSGVVFPMFVLVACGTDLRGVPGLAGEEAGMHTRVPMFNAAEASAHLIVDCVTGRVPVALRAARVVAGIVKFLRM